ncbi:MULTISPECIES: prephenate/arogenate dehydrogenase family protein [unclassified Caulobacter]|jgi:cyclohexadieny/prephenate dehydrogenase|uniref:prephenate/arogenate dehydrogenase family protein n=1 Tax=unclassified Caulobacter TaxID=2648921 RepID=UPI000646E284|nr:MULTISPECIES: prephenate/arogenate dehydrogenase family protein [unclassified Caulobacter]KQV56628.1 cyclohexadienyl dehydrogenase [Caulobacter sp. Root342]KQV72265.1 cyclohexadienyl dehydrogenase [Caulobacter sp. Root343]
MSAPGILYPKLTVIGCGLIGGSVIRAAREHGVVGEVTVADASEAHRARVVELGIAEHVTGDIAQAVKDADLVVIATPVLSIPELAAVVIPAMKAGATLTDVGSTKANVAEAFRAQDPSKIFAIPGHPIAGTEQSGPDSGFAELFENRWTILTPFESDDEHYAAAVAKLSAFWRAFGAQVELMEEKHHDLVLAVVSHLPHLIAYTIVGSAADLENVTENEVIKYSASGFRDFTRIAASDPTMWRDIFVANKDAVLEMLGRFTEDLQAMSRAIRWGDADTLHAHFTRTRAIRRGIVAAGQESAEPNFGRDRGKH